MAYRLSPSSLNLFLECPRCFWLDKNRNIKRPRGIFPSLPGGMDLVIKTYFDRYRVEGKLPPELVGRVEGRLFPDLSILNKWRSWRSTDLVYEDRDLKVSLSGALDDCLVDGDFYIPLDYKTRGSEPENPKQYYQNQLDCYCLMLQAKGYKTKGIAYLVYYYPESVEENGIVKFAVTPIKIETNPETAKGTVRRAARCLKGPLPEKSDTCEYCHWLRQRYEVKIDSEPLCDTEQKIGPVHRQNKMESDNQQRLL